MMQRKSRFKRGINLYRRTYQDHAYWRARKRKPEWRRVSWRHLTGMRVKHLAAPAAYWGRWL